MFLRENKSLFLKETDKLGSFLGGKILIFISY